MKKSTSLEVTYDSIKHQLVPDWVLRAIVICSASGQAFGMQVSELGWRTILEHCPPDNLERLYEAVEREVSSESHEMVDLLVYDNFEIFAVLGEWLDNNWTRQVSKEAKLEIISAAESTVDRVKKVKKALKKLSPAHFGILRAVMKQLCKKWNPNAQIEAFHSFSAYNQSVGSYFSPHQFSMFDPTLILNALVFGSILFVSDEGDEREKDSLDASPRGPSARAISIFVGRHADSAANGDGNDDVHDIGSYEIDPVDFQMRQQRRLQRESSDPDFIGTARAEIAFGNLLNIYKDIFPSANPAQGQGQGQGQAQGQGQGQAPPKAQASEDLPKSSPNRPSSVIRVSSSSNIPSYPVALRDDFFESGAESSPGSPPDTPRSDSVLRVGQLTSNQRQENEERVFKELSAHLRSSSNDNSLRRELQEFREESRQSVQRLEAKINELGDMCAFWIETVFEKFNRQHTYMQNRMFELDRRLAALETHPPVTNGIRPSHISPNLEGVNYKLPSLMRLNLDGTGERMIDKSPWSVPPNKTVEDFMDEKLFNMFVNSVSVNAEHNEVDKLHGNQKHPPQLHTNVAVPISHGNFSSSPRPRHDFKSTQTVRDDAPFDLPPMHSGHIIHGSKNGSSNGSNGGQPLLVDSMPTLTSVVSDLDIQSNDNGAAHRVFVNGKWVYYTYEI